MPGLTRTPCYVQVDGVGSKRSSRTIAVGTATGSVKAFDVSLGHLLWQATGVMEGCVQTQHYETHSPDAAEQPHDVLCPWLMQMDGYAGA